MKLVLKKRHPSRLDEIQKTLGVKPGLSPLNTQESQNAKKQFAPLEIVNKHATKYLQK